VSFSGLDLGECLIADRGEQTASALERQLDGIESRIDELLAAAEASANGSEDSPQDPSGSPSNDASNDQIKKK